MRYLFLMLALLGFATAGDLRGRSAPTGSKGRAPQSHVSAAPTTGVATISEDGTPIPRR